MITTYSDTNESEASKCPVDGRREEILVLVVLDNSVPLQHVVTKCKQHPVHYALIHQGNNVIHLYIYKVLSNQTFLRILTLLMYG